MDNQRGTTIFEDLPEFAKQKLAEGPPRHKDWKVCEHCRVHATEKKLLACARCRPFVTMPVYYCSRECQKAEWKLHKEECKGLADGPVMPTKSKNHPNHNVMKRMEHWHYLHRLTIRWAIVQALLCDPSINPKDVTFLVNIHIDEDPRDPPLAWPTAFKVTGRILPDADSSWPEDVGDTCEYVLSFPGGPLYIPFQLGDGWRAVYESGHGIFADWDLMFLNLCRTTPTTLKAAALQLDLLQNALSIARPLNAVSFAPLDEARKSQRNDQDRLDVNFSLLPQWVDIVKKAQIWAKLDEFGVLRKLIAATDSQDSTRIPGGFGFVRVLQI